MPVTRVLPLLVGLLLASACSEKSEGTFAYGTQGKPSSAPAAPATPAPTAAPAATPATPAIPATPATPAAAPTGTLPPSGNPATRTNPTFYLPPDADLTTAPSGLKYLRIREGSGTPPIKSGNFTAHYCGWYTSGEVFDSSYARNEPLHYPVNLMIPGWQEALTTLMKPGSEYILVVSPELGYGVGGGNGIPPNSTLVFRMELLSAD